MAQPQIFLHHLKEPRRKSRTKWPLLNPVPKAGRSAIVIKNLKEKYGYKNSQIAISSDTCPAAN